MGVPFQESAESLRAKLGLSTIGKPVIAGICITALIAFGIVVFAVFELAADGHGVVIEKSQHDEDSVSSANTAESSDLRAPEASPKGDASSAPENSPLAETAPIFIHVTGAVMVPGLYELEEGDRVQKAIDAAGGFTEEGSLTSVNLARLLNDGEQIIVPTQEEAAKSEPEYDSQATQSGSAPLASGKVNINTADAAALMTLPGIGEATAAKIIADREARGHYRAPEDLKRVSGIGDKKFADLASLITVG